MIPLKRFVENSSNKEVLSLTGILLVGNFIIPTINFALDIKVETFMVFSQYVTYIILGYVIGGLVEDRQGECCKRCVDALINRGGGYGFAPGALHQLLRFSFSAHLL